MQPKMEALLPSSMQVVSGKWTEDCGGQFPRFHQPKWWVFSYWFRLVWKLGAAVWNIFFLKISSTQKALASSRPCFFPALLLPGLASSRHLLLPGQSFFPALLLPGLASSRPCFFPALLLPGLSGDISPTCVKATNLGAFSSCPLSTVSPDDDDGAHMSMAYCLGRRLEYKSEKWGALYKLYSAFIWKLLKMRGKKNYRAIDVGR